MSKGERRAVGIVVLFLVMDILTGMTRSIDAEVGAAGEIIAEKDRRIAVLENDRAKYEESLQMIVTKLYEREAYNEIGGSVPRSENEIEVVYEAIMNATGDFSELLQNVGNYFDERAESIAEIPSIFPVPYGEDTRITSGFGWRVYPFTGEVEFHKGIDIAAWWNTNILATADGVVLDCWIMHPVYGKMIRIDHGNGFITLYAHMSETRVRERTEVRKGDVIGVMGNTGRSLGRHLHYEIELDGELVNPLEYLSSNRILVMGK